MKSTQRLYQKYKRDADLMYPLHKSDVDNPQRKNFILQLINSNDFVKTYTNNNKKLAEPLKETIKKFGFKEYVAILGLTIMCGGFGYVITQDNAGSVSKTTPYQTTKDTAVILMAALVGLAIGGGVTVAIKQANRELSTERFYHRMIIRLFDKMKKIHHDLDEKTLKLCNPEMLRVVTALLIANMTTEQILKLQSIALKIMDDNKYVPTYIDETLTLRVYEKALNEALVMVESHLINNPGLKETILNVFKGNIPAQFIINEKNQNTK